jgi:D-inositol-3-phosphate glycosyltransferase
MEINKSLPEKVVYIIDPVGRKAGLDHYNDSLASNLNSSGTKTIVYSNYNSEYSQKKFSFNFTSSPLFIPGILTSYLIVFKELKLHKPEFVVFHLFKASKFLLWFSRRLINIKVKLIFIVHDVESLISNSENYEQMKSLLSLADHIIVHNNFSKEELAKKYSIEDAKINLIPHGDYLDLPSQITKSEARNKLNLKSDLPIVLFFGMIKPTKGLDVLLKAMQDINAQLIVAGRMRMNSISDYSTWTDNLIHEGKLITDIRYISNEKRDLYFKAADVIVLPYRKIYQSGVLMMALSYQLPVIASDLVPNKELAAEFDAIEMFPTGDHNQLSEKLNRLLTDQIRQEELKKNGFALLSQNHNWKLISQLFNKIIRK